MTLFCESLARTNFREFRENANFRKFRENLFSRISRFFFQIREIRENKFSRIFLSRKLVHAKISTFKVKQLFCIPFSKYKLWKFLRWQIFTHPGGPVAKLQNFGSNLSNLISMNKVARPTIFRRPSTLPPSWCEAGFNFWGWKTKSSSRNWWRWWNHLPL